jgi:hypothetical protein
MTPSDCHPLAPIQAIQRLAVVLTDALGAASFSPSLGSAPLDSLLDAGETWRFQFWYRDSIGLGSNLSETISIRFCP